MITDKEVQEYIDEARESLKEFCDKNETKRMAAAIHNMVISGGAYAIMNDSQKKMAMDFVEEVQGWAT